jgi:hypothetical protein
MKVKIQNRSVYHKIAEVEVEVPDGMECNDIHEWLLDNEDLYIDKIDEKLSKAIYFYGFGLGDGMDEMDQESEWRYEYGDRYGGHL